MGKNSIFDRVRNEVLSLYESPSRKNELFFLILFGFYEAFNFFLKIKWNDNVDVDFLRVGFVWVIMFGASIYLIYTIGEWKNLFDRYLWILYLVGVALLVIAGYLSTQLSTNAFSLIFDLYFCIMVIGKDYKKILRNTMWIGIGTLVFCFIGMFFGITVDVVKPENIHPGHSLGTVYPNTWGYLIFLILMIVWYLYLRRRSFIHQIIMFLAFWGVSAFLYLYIYCRTISFLTIAFPIFAVIVDWIEKRTDERIKVTQGSNKERINKLDIERKQKLKKENKVKIVISKKKQYNIDTSSTQSISEIKKQSYLSAIIAWVVAAIPYLSFAFVMIASYQYRWVHKQFYYTFAHNMAMRFVQAGMYFTVYGIPFVGNPYDSRNYAYVEVNGEFLQVGVLDSSFASYIIMRGLLWILLCMLWLCIANWKALKMRDYAIPMIGLFILVYAMMERPGLELWYNFILLYPLARVESKTGAEMQKKVKPTLYKNRANKRKG